MKKIITSGLFALIFIISASITAPVHALTQEDVSQLIDLGLIPPSRIAAARAAAAGDNSLLNNPSFSQGSSNSSTGSTNTIAGTDKSGCLKLSTDIVEGISGTAVSSLQRFLKEQGDFDHPEITGYFGSVTREAIQKFQIRQNIVLSGTPYTTGFGAVGPTTRSVIEKLTCVDGVGTDGGDYDADFDYDTNNFFGQNLDDLFNYEADFSYDVGDGEDFNFDYDVDFDYDADFRYDTGRGYDFNFNYDADFDYDADFGFNDEEQIEVELSVRDSSGDFIRGARGNIYIPVSSQSVEIKWASKNTDHCFLTGDYTQRSLAVPNDGSAQAFLVNPSYQLPSDDPDFTVAAKPLFSLKITCDDDRLYGNSNSDSVFMYIED